MSPSPLPREQIDERAPKKKKIKDDVEEAVLEHLKERAEDRKRRQQETDDDYFGRHIAGVLKRLPSRAKAIARLKIEQVLLEAEFPEPQTQPTYPKNIYSGYPC